MKKEGGARAMVRAEEENFKRKRQTIRQAIKLTPLVLRAARFPAFIRKSS